MQIMCGANLSDLEEEKPREGEGNADKKNDKDKRPCTLANF
jgi:hypothetical protein